MKRIRSKASLCLAMLTALSMTGCMDEDEFYEHENKNSISFSWWGKDQRNEYTIEAVKEFEKQTGLNVTVRFSEYEGFKNIMDMDFYSGTEADVMQLNYDWLYEYSPDGEGFYDLRELRDDVNLSAFPSEDLKPGMIGGHLNAVPTSFNAITFYYNKDLYLSYGLPLPETWDDLFEAAEVMQKDGVYPIELSSKSAWLSAVAYYEQTTGRELYMDGTDLKMTEEDYKLMLGFYCELLEKGVTKHSDDFDRNDLEREKCAAVAVWISDAEYYCDPSIEQGKNIVIGDYPCAEGAELFGWYKKPTSLYAIKKDTKNPKAAAMLLDFLCSSEEMNLRQKLGKGIPSSKSALEILEANDLLNGIQFDANAKMKETESIGMMSPYLEDTEAVSLFSETAAEILDGEWSLEEAAADTYPKMYERLKS